MLGLLALFVQYILVILVTTLVVWESWKNPTLRTSPWARLRLYKTILFIMAFPYFLWAIFKTYNGDFDLGIFSLGSVVVTAFPAKCEGPLSYFCVRAADDGRLRYSTPLACLLVAFNYAYALHLVTEPPSFVLYALSGLTIWSILSVFGFILLYRFPGEMEEEECPYKPIPHTADIHP